MKNILTIASLLLCQLTATAQNVMQAEYFVDSDAGVGNNTLIMLTNPQPDGSYNLNINLSGLTIGQHKLYIRTKDNDSNWSFTSRRNIEIVSSNVSKKIVSGEYFFDADPGYNSAIPVTVSPSDSVILQNFAAVTSSLAVGYHKLYIRLKDNDGNWSLTARRNVEVNRSSLYVIAGAEYFFNTDPGIGNADPVVFSNAAADGSFDFKIPLDKIPAGAHTLYIRARDSVNSNWSITQWEKDLVITSSGLDTLWSHPAAWSNNKVPDANTVVVLRHKIYVDIPTATCKSLAPYKVPAECIVWPGMKLLVTGRRN